MPTTSNDEHSSRSEQGAEAILSYLQDFGLNEKEAKIFFILSKKGSLTTTEITSLTEFSKLQSYRAIKELLNKGLVEMSLERPRRFTALRIEQALNLLGQEAEKKILELEKKTPLLLKEWSASNALQANTMNYTFRIIQGIKNVEKFRTMLFQSAKKDIAVTIRPNELMKLVIDGADDVFEKLTVSNNVSIRGLSEVNKFNVNASKRFLEFSKFHHVIHPNIVPFTIIDQQEALICLSRDGKDGLPENAIWTNHPEMTRILMGFFEMLWGMSQDGKSRIFEIERASNLKQKSSERILTTNLEK
jgi:sugar-specific transcriptional regulator TrmB